jgi:hypothetical protein
VSGSTWARVSVGRATLTVGDTGSVPAAFGTSLEVHAARRMTITARTRGTFEGYYSSGRVWESFGCIVKILLMAPRGVGSTLRI